jgi:hypothetical protein
MDEASSELISRSSCSISLTWAEDVGAPDAPLTTLEVAPLLTSKYELAGILGEMGECPGDTALSEMLVAEEAGPGDGEVFQPKKEVSLVPGDLGFEVEVESHDSTE